MDNGAPTTPLALRDAPTPDAEHRIVVNFKDDNTIAGAKIDIHGVTSAQIMVAVYYLTRSANQLDDAAALAAEMHRREITSVSDMLRKGK